MKIRKHISYSVDHEGVELEIPHEPVDYYEPLVKRLSDGTFRVGYLAQDIDCESPLETCDGMGTILTFNRDYTNHIDPSEVRSRMPTGFEHTVIGLSYGEHGPGSGHWSVNCPVGENLPDDWDGTYDELRGYRHDGVWIPDKSLLEDIEIRAIKNLTGKTPDFNSPAWKEGRRPLVAIINPDGQKSRETEVALEDARVACDEYTKWIQGECYGIVVVTCDAKGHYVDDDSCWGFIGMMYAEQSLKEQFDSSCQEKAIA